MQCARVESSAGNGGVSHEFFNRGGRVQSHRCVSVASEI